MPASLRGIEWKCDGNCGRRALVQLYDTWNGPLGRYCRRCGAAALRAQLAREAEHFRRGDPPPDPVGRALHEWATKRGP